jgi:hypothetical protein
MAVLDLERKLLRVTAPLGYLRTLVFWRRLPTDLREGLRPRLARIAQS